MTGKKFVRIVTLGLFMAVETHASWNDLCLAHERLDRVIRHQARLNVFCALWEVRLTQDVIDLTFAYEFYQNYSKNIIPEHDFEFACRDAKRRGLPSPAILKFYQERADYLFQKTLEIAVTYPDLADLIEAEQNSLLETEAPLENSCLSYEEYLYLGR